MKKILFLLLFMGTAATVSAQVNFVDVSTDRLHEMAIEQNKLVFIDLFAPWCPPCRAMDSEVFPRKDVGDFMNAHFVNAKYNVDEYTGQMLMKKYNAKGVPTYLIFNSEGELLGSIVGASGPDEFLYDVRRIIHKHQPKK